MSSSATVPLTVTELLPGVDGGWLVLEDLRHVFFAPLRRERRYIPKKENMFSKG